MIIFEYTIEEFWQKFEQSVMAPGFDAYDSEFLNFIDNRINAWDLTWEIGPGVNTEFSLTISPGGDISRIEKVMQVLDKVPGLNDWEFFSFKQPKSNWHKLFISDNGIEIDALDWTYVLYKHPGDNFEIELKADNITHHNRETQDLIADLILTNLPGEKLKMEKLFRFVIVNEFEVENKSSEIRCLPKQILGPDE